MKSGDVAEAVDRTVDERHRAKRFFNRIAPAFHVIDRRLGPQYRRALGELSLPSGRSVLDIGTGTGTLAKAFADRGHHVTGVDFADRLLDKARRRVPSGDFRSMDLVGLQSMPSDLFDVVCLGYVLHGLSPELRKATFHIAARLARVGVLVFDYSRRGPWYVRLIEWIEGPNYGSFFDESLDQNIGPCGLVVWRRGATSSYGGWWWCVNSE